MDDSLGGRTPGSQQGTGYGHQAGWKQSTEIYLICWCKLPPWSVRLEKGNGGGVQDIAKDEYLEAHQAPVQHQHCVGTASAASPIPWHLCIFTLMASHAIINLCPRQACSYPLFRFTTTWYYSLTLHCFLYHHFLMIPWLCDSVFSPFLYILSYSFLAPQTLYHIRVWHLRWATLYTWCLVLYHINYVPVAIIFTGEYI